jgi:hypothetical protein
MKKPWLLIFAGVILITLIGLWLYLFFGGDEAKEDLYNAFGLQGDELPFGLEDIFGNNYASSTPQYLRQLSLRQVAGYIPLNSEVLFTEAGTGHIYSVRVENGAEERLSNITIPGANNASFSPDGLYVAITSHGGRTITVITLPHSSTTLASIELDINPISISFASNSTLLYATKEGQSVRGYAYNMSTGTTKVIFTIPFREVTILWGNNVDGPHYAYPKSAEELEGYLYEVEAGAITRLPISGFGLSAMASNDIILYSVVVNNDYLNYVYYLDTKSSSLLQLSSIPDKCIAVSTGIVCGSDREKMRVGAQTLWYQSDILFKDSLWYTPSQNNYSLVIDYISEKAERDLDIYSLRTNQNSLFFVNKADAGLWVYERDFTSPVIDN